MTSNSMKIDKEHCKTNEPDNMANSSNTITSTSRYIFSSLCLTGHLVKSPLTLIGDSRMHSGTFPITIMDEMELGSGFRVIELLKSVSQVFQICREGCGHWAMRMS